jgi:hypothetical protein
MWGVEHCQNPDQYIVTGWRGTRPPADDFGEHIIEGRRALQGRSNRLRHPSGFVPGSIRRDCRKNSESTDQTRLDLVLVRRQPSRSRATVNDKASAARPDAHETRSDIDGVAVAKPENVEVRWRYPNAERKVSLLCGKERPHLFADHQIHSAREHAVNDTEPSWVRVEGVTNWLGLDSCRLAHEIALMNFSESDTQPKSHPVPWSFLAFAD